jgi:regulator of sigma E protease
MTTTILATVIVLGVLIFVHEFGHFLLAKLLKVRVLAFSLGFPPKLLHRQVGETDYRLSVLPVGGYVKLLGENPNEEVPPELEPYSFQHHPLWHRSLIVLAGPCFNFFFAVVALFLTFALSGIPYLTTEVGGIKPDSPAAHAGLQPGDRVLAVGGVPVQHWDQLSEQIRENGERPLTLSVQRGDRRLKIQVVPQRMEATDIFGEKVSAVLIGVSSADKLHIERVGPLRALEEGTAYSYRITRLTVLSIYKLVTRQIPLTTLGGPIMIAQVAGKQAQAGVNPLIHFMAILSINLFLLNLLPIPILDGGHMVFILWEAVRGKPMALKHREVAQAVGMMLLLAFMLLVFYQDVVRFFGSRT